MKIIARLKYHPRLTASIAIFIYRLRVDVKRKLILIFSCNKREVFSMDRCRSDAASSDAELSARYEETGRRGCQRPVVSRGVLKMHRYFNVSRTRRPKLGRRDAVRCATI